MPTNDNIFTFMIRINFMLNFIDIEVIGTLGRGSPKVKWNKIDTESLPCVDLEIKLRAALHGASQLLGGGPLMWMMSCTCMLI